MSERENPSAKAIFETATMVATAKAETRKRGFWGYIQVAELTRWAESRPWPGGVVPKTDEALARVFFGVRLDATVVCATQGGAPMFAVWRKAGEPTVEPTFDLASKDIEVETPRNLNQYRDEFLGVIVDETEVSNQDPYR